MPRSHSTEGENPQKTFSFSIDLPVRNEWRNVDLLRTSVQNCFAAIFKDIDGCHAVSMVTGELLENAMKYGQWEGDEPGEQLFRLRVTGNAEGTKISVQNPVLSDSQTAQDLLGTLEWIAGHNSAEEAYRARLLEIANDDHVGGSRLGLVRAAYEGDCQLSAKVDGNTVTVVADIAR